jgi:hypothetical protein
MRIASTRPTTTVGSPAEVVEKILSFREHFGNYRRQLFGVDQAGLPESTVLEMLDIIGADVLPHLRAATQSADASIAS